MRKPDATITIDLPPLSSHPNRGMGNRRSRHFAGQRRNDASGEIVWSHALELGSPRWKSVTIRLTFVLPPLKPRGTDRRHDPDNLIAWSKASLDLLTKHGILADDRDVIYLPPVQRRAGKPIVGFKQSMPGMTIEIWQRREGECPFCGHPQLTDASCAE